MCFGKEEEPCGHLEQLSSILDAEWGCSSLPGRFLGCLWMTFYLASEKQKGLYNLTAKEAGGSCLFFRVSEVSCPRFSNCFFRFCEWRSQGTSKPLSESHLGLKASLATQEDITHRAQLTEPVLALPQTSSRACGRSPRPSLPPFPHQGSRARHSQLVFLLTCLSDLL